MLLSLVVFVGGCVFGAHPAHTGSKLSERWMPLPELDPLEIEEVKLESSVTHLGFDITLTNISIFGLCKTEVTDFQVDFEDQSHTLTLFVPTLEVISTYNVSGEILELPIMGSGPGNVTIKDIYATFALSFNLEEDPKDPEDHITVKDFSLDFNTTRVHIKLDNLFDGDEDLGSAMNEFLNDSWKELVSQISPVISSAIRESLTANSKVIGKMMTYYAG